MARADTRGMTTTQTDIAEAARTAGWEVRGETAKYAGYRAGNRSINIEWTPRGGIAVAVVNGSTLRGANKAARILAELTR
jgi:hypothetical protein